MTVAAVIGWLLAIAVCVLALSLRARLGLVARAEHELRSPITALALATETLRRESGAINAATLEAHVDRARAGLSDLEAARAGRRAALRPEPVTLDRFGQAVVSAWDSVARRNGKGVSFHWEGEPVTLEADRGSLAKALGNLIANALEHGEGHVEVGGRRTGAGAQLGVWDGGAGFAPKRSRSSLGSGRGRGLAIAAEAARRAGGSISVASRTGRSNVTLELPIDPPR